MEKWREVEPNSMSMETDMLVASVMTNLMELVFGIVLPNRPKDRVSGNVVRE